MAVCMDIRMKIKQIMIMHTNIVLHEFTYVNIYHIYFIYIVVAGDGEKLDGKCLYFLRDTQRPVNLKIAQDVSILAGELNADILQTFEASLSQVRINDQNER